MEVKERIEQVAYATKNNVKYFICRKHLNEKGELHN